LWRELQENKNRVLAEKEEISREEMKIQRLIDDLEIKIKKESKSNLDFDKKRAALEKKQEELFEEINKIRKEAAFLDAKIEIEKEKARNFEIIQEIPVDLPYIRARIKEIREKYQNIENKLKNIKEAKELNLLREEFSELRKEVDKLWQEVSEGRKKEEKNSPKREKIVNLKTIGELEEKRKLAYKKIEELSRLVEKNRSEINNLIKIDRQTREEYFQMESALRERQFEISRIREKLNELRIEIAKIEVREEDIVKRVREDLNLDSPDLVEMPQKSEETPDLEALEREINRLKIQAEQIGAIDPMIVEEYEETQKRYDFLTNQSEDLEKSMQALKEVIKEMEVKIKESFEEAFQKINAEFSKYFKIIFGGGNAELVKKRIEKRRNEEELEETELEAKENETNKEKNDQPALTENSIGKEEIGIEVKACPPGKRISSLNMLSGGERALASLALLFAIISHNPPPFMILDEVEAALDEANSKRFSRILAELSNETQFILITHNRETMRQASILYGVTMSADGVSKVLSVKLDQVDEKGEIR